MSRHLYALNQKILYQYVMEYKLFTTYHDVSLYNVLPHREPTTLESTHMSIFARETSLLVEEIRSRTHLLVICQHTLHHPRDAIGHKKNLPGPLSTVCILTVMYILHQNSGEDRQNNELTQIE